MTRVLIMAGGTGGHVFPALAVASVLRARQCDVRWLGTRAGIEARLVPAAGIPIDWVAVGGLRGKGFARLLVAPFVLARAIFEACAVIRRQRPDVVLGLGGFVSGPGGVAAWLLRRPLVIHEQNAIAGLTNRLLARLATRVAEAFPGSYASTRATTVVGNPVRADIEALNAHRRPQVPGAPRLFVFGGSLGAKVLNRILPEALALLAPAERPRVLHQSGRARASEVAALYAERGIDAEVREFVDDMAEAYRWADLAVCRGGALTIAELAAARLASVLVPYPHAVDDHQTANANYLVSRGAARLLPEVQLSAESMAQTLRELLAGDRTALQAMSEAAGHAAVLGAAGRLADLCVDCAGGRP